MDAKRFAERAGVSADVAERIAIWGDLLKRWNARINLVGLSTLDDFWVRHALDSLQVYRAAPIPGRWIDLGAGAGFPGLAIAAMLTESDSGECHLVESNKKKAAFLREAVRAMDVNAQIHSKRWQDMTPEAFDALTARAFAPLPDLLEAAFTFWGPSARGVFPKGRDHQQEIEAARRLWRFDVEAIPSITGDGAILIVTELESRV